MICILSIGAGAAAGHAAGSTDYALTAFNWAFATQYLWWAVGIVQTLRCRSLFRRIASIHLAANRSAGARTEAIRRIVVARACTVNDVALN